MLNMAKTVFNIALAGSVIILFGLVFNRIYALASQAPDLAANFFCLGVLASLGFQVFINIGMNIGIVPITGITLPLFSFGGSSIIATFLGLGLISGFKQKEKQPIAIR